MAVWPLFWWESRRVCVCVWECRYLCNSGRQANLSADSQRVRLKYRGQRGPVSPRGQHYGTARVLQGVGTHHNTGPLQQGLRTTLMREGWDARAQTLMCLNNSNIPTAYFSEIRVRNATVRLHILNTDIYGLFSQSNMLICLLSGLFSKTKYYRI